MALVAAVDFEVTDPAGRPRIVIVLDHWTSPGLAARVVEMVERINSEHEGSSPVVIAGSATVYGEAEIPAGREGDRVREMVEYVLADGMADFDETYLGRMVKIEPLRERREFDRPWLKQRRSHAAHGARSPQSRPAMNKSHGRGRWR